jgi:hypothetical protein
MHPKIQQNTPITDIRFHILRRRGV